MRLLAAFLAAPLAPAALPAWFAYQKGLSPLAVYGGVCAAFWGLQLVIGVPAWRLLRRFPQRQAVWLFAVAGFAGVAGPLAAWAALAGRPAAPTFLAPYLGLLGALTAVIFWLLTRPDRADRP